MTYDSLLELVKERRSIRKFKPDPVPDEYIDKIIEVARWAPSGANAQPWEFIVVKKQELKDKIIEWIGDFNELSHKMEIVRKPELRFHWAPPGYVRAPVFIIVCGDPRVNEVYPLSVVRSRAEENFISALASAFLYMTLSVTTLGLGAQWVSAIAQPYVQSLTKDLLGVPQDLEFYDMLAVGYPDAEPKPRPVRARGEMVHHDYYDKTRFRTQQQIDDFIASLRHGHGHAKG